jgi:UDP-glucose 4-epimerase
MARILVIGANGYIGARLSSLLAMSGNSVTALCFPSVPEDEKWCSLMDEVVVGDVTSDKAIDDITNQYYDVAIHLVSLDHHDSNKSPSFVSSINVMPVWKLLEAFKTKKTLSRFIYFSTIHVYGKIPSQVIEESEDTNPISQYGLTHLLAENICNMYTESSEIDCINVRLSNSYGQPVFQTNNCWWLVINDLCKTAYYEKKIKLLSDGSSQRDFIHSTDVFKAIDTLIKTEKVPNTNSTYHISSGKTITILELAHVVKSVFEKRYIEEIEVTTYNDTKSKHPNTFSDANRYLISNTKLKSLGFSPAKDIETGIEEMFIYFEGVKWK